MPDTTRVSKRIPTRILVMLGSALCWVLLHGSTCVPPNPPPPELEAPDSLTAQVVCRKYQDAFQEFILLRWANPNTDSISVHSVGVIREIPTGDTTSNRVTSTVDGALSELLQPTSGLVQRNETKTIYYRVFTIDTLERIGDTSQVCSVYLAPRVNLNYPLDSLSENTFHWNLTIGFGAFYETDFSVWSTTDTATIWISDTTIEFGQPFTSNAFLKGLPPSLYPLPKGSYFWAVRYEIFLSPQNPRSFTVGTFNVY